MYKIRQDEIQKIRKKYQTKYISEKADISRVHLYNIFNGKSNCSKKTAKLIANSIDYEVEDLFIEIN